MRTTRTVIILGTFFTLYTAHSAFSSTVETRPFTHAVSAGTISSLRHEIASSPAKIPAGTEIPVMFTSAAASGTSRKGDVVTATVTRDIWIGGRVAIPSGARITGRVTSSTRDASDSAAPQLSVEFTRLSGKSASLALVSPDLRDRAHRNMRLSNARFITGSILLGAILGHQVNQRRAEVGALLGGLAGAADATRSVPEIRLRSGESGLLKLSRDLIL